ncbi:MAG: tetratricopeptide repeat protein [Planctomycetaceae bacterium]|nr:tetratricopeptide repeat protein [Planctomycetaceae bacterium]
MTLVRIFTWFAAVTGASCGVALGQLETVVKLDDSRLTGKMLEMNATEISIERNRQASKISVQEIDHIRFSDEPNRMNQVREQINGRQFEQAAKELAGMSWEGLRPETVLDGLYYSAKVKAELALMGVAGHSLADAVGLLRKFQESGKNHYQYNRAMLLYGQLAFSANRLPLAIETFQGLTGVADQMTAIQAYLELGNAQLLDNKPVEAAQSFKKAAEFDLADAQSLRLKQTAKIMGHVAEAGNGGIEASVSAIQAIIANESPDDVFLNAVAYNALGRLQFGANQMRDAELAYLHTELLFASNPQAHPEALFHLIKIWSDAGKTDRATEAREKLKGRYGGSYWATKLTN